MDPVGAPLSNDVHNNQTHRQSILGSFLRVRPRGTSQSHQSPTNFSFQPDNDINININGSGNSSNNNNLATPHASALSDHAIAVNVTNGGNFAAINGNGGMPIQPPSPGSAAAQAGHRRRPAAGGAGALQQSNSGAMASFGLNIAPSSTGNVSTMHGLSQMLRRRRSANGALTTSSANPSGMGANSPIDSHNPTASSLPVNPPRAQPAQPPPNGNQNSGARSHRIRLVPHLDSSRSLHFEPICRDVREGDTALRIGRFTDRSGLGVAALNAQNTNKLAFKSKVVSRAHAEVWCESGGKFYIKDTKSSSGTFLNHIRLSAPNTDSKPFPIKDGDVLQLGVDYQGGTEEIYKCVKMRIELGREWQSQPNAFNTNALKQLKTIACQPAPDKPGAKTSLAKSGIPDCCICLFSVTVHQALFIAPCSHVFHYKCIRPMLNMHHPGFSCPLCRTFANLEEDVEVDSEEFPVDVDTDGADGAGIGSGGSSGADGAVPHALPMVAGADVSFNAMDVDPVFGSASDLAAQIHASGAETEVERDFAPPSMRRRNNTNNPNANTIGVPIRGQYSPVRGGGPGYFESLPEDVDEYLSAASDELHHEHHDHYETDDLHPLPAVPVPAPNGPLTVPSASSSASSVAASAPAQMQGLVIQRPMSVPYSASGQDAQQEQSPPPIPTPVQQYSQAQAHSSAYDDCVVVNASDGEEDENDDEMGAVRRAIGMGVGMTVGGDGNASGSSSGEGVGTLGVIGEKRKR